MHTSCPHFQSLYLGYHGDYRYNHTSPYIRDTYTYNISTPYSFNAAPPKSCTNSMQTQLRCCDRSQRQCVRFSQCKLHNAQFCTTVHQLHAIHSIHIVHCIAMQITSGQITITQCIALEMIVHPPAFQSTQSTN